MVEWLPADPLALLLAPLGVFVIAALKGAFGGGFALLGIPLLALAMDPVEAGALLAPLFLAMDLFALRYWKPGTWSRPDLAGLLPGLPLGVLAGAALIAVLPRPAVGGIMAVVTLAFAARYFLQRGAPAAALPPNRGRAIAAGAASGLTTMLAHSGGPPLAMYLLPRGLPKSIYAGTTSLFFTFANLLKVGPWLFVGSPTAATWALMALASPMVPLGVWAGWRLHNRVDETALIRACYGLLVAVGLKLLWDAAVAL